MAFACIAGIFSCSALMRATALGAVFLGATTGSALARCGEPVKPGRQPTTVETGDGNTRPAVYFIPSSYTGKDKVAVVFDLHGSNSNPQGQLNRSSWDKVAEKNGFIVMALQGSLPGVFSGTYAWNVPFVTQKDGGLDEIDYISRAVDKVADDFCVDTSRIYASGYSGGGRMLSAYICSGRDDFAAAGFVHSLRAGRPVEIDGEWGPDKDNCNPAKPISIMAFAGVKDKANPYAGGGKAYWRYGFATAIRRWTELDGCTGNGDPKTVDHVTFSFYGTCKRGARIASFVFARGTHAWPRPTPAAEAVAAAAREGIAGVAKVAAVSDASLSSPSPSRPAFDPSVDPASRMWDFFGKVGGTDIVATATAGKATSGTGIASACSTEESKLQGTTCSSSQPIEMRRSGQGVRDAL